MRGYPNTIRLKRNRKPAACKQASPRVTIRFPFGTKRGTTPSAPSQTGLALDVPSRTPLAADRHPAGPLPGVGGQLGDRQDDERGRGASVHVRPEVPGGFPLFVRVAESQRNRALPFPRGAGPRGGDRRAVRGGVRVGLRRSQLHPGFPDLRAALRGTFFRGAGRAPVSPGGSPAPLEGRRPRSGLCRAW